MIFGVEYMRSFSLGILEERLIALNRSLVKGRLTKVILRTSLDNWGPKPQATRGNGHTGSYEVRIDHCSAGPASTSEPSRSRMARP